MLKLPSKDHIFIAASLLACDFSRLAEEIQSVEKAGADLVHVDVMDGHFVPNLTIGPCVVEAIRRSTRLPLDVHLMIEEPLRYLDDFRDAGSDSITIHYEACRNISKTLGKVQRLGAGRGISLRPRTPARVLEPFLDRIDLILVMTVEPGFGGQSFIAAMLKKVQWLRKKFRGHIAVDGGINPETARRSVQAGADILVAGTSIFRQKNRKRAIEALRHAAR